MNIEFVLGLAKMNGGVVLIFMVMEFVVLYLLLINEVVIM